MRELKKSLKNAEKECDRLEPEVKKKSQAVAPKQQKAPKKQTDVDFGSFFFFSNWFPFSIY